MRAFRRLDELRSPDTPHVGRKAAALGELAGAGFPVPPGFVLPITAYLAAIASGGMRGRLVELHGRALAAVDDRPLLGALCTEAAAVVEKVGVPGPQLELLRSAYEALGDDVSARGAWVAVRTSSTGDDAVDATRTNVRGLDEVTGAVVACWASVFTPAAVAYRAAAGEAAEPTTAVIVQRMVPAQRAGIVHTADPATGERGVVVVEAVFGQGEVVVSGAVEPDVYRFVGPRARLTSLVVGHKTHQVVRGRDGHDLTTALDVERADGRVLTDDEARAVARLAQRVDRCVGHPVELGWAMVARQIWLLSSRPVAPVPLGISSG